MKIRKIEYNKWLKSLSASNQHQLEFIRCMYWPDNHDLIVNYTPVKNHLLVFVEKGIINAVLDEEEIQLHEGMTVWIPPGVMRSFHYSQQCQILSNYRLHFDLFETDDQLCFNRKSLFLKNSWSIQPYFNLLNQAYQNPYQYNFEYVKGALICLSTVFNHLLLHQTETKCCLSIQQQQIINQFIMDRIHDRIKSADLAKLMRFSQDYFSRIFRNTFGESPRSYFIKVRIRFAANQLLESNLSIKELAYKLGYKDENLFCRQFRKIMNCTPKQYRMSNI